MRQCNWLDTCVHKVKLNKANSEGMKARHYRDKACTLSKGYKNQQNKRSRDKAKTTKQRFLP